MSWESAATAGILSLAGVGLLVMQLRRRQFGRASVRELPGEEDPRMRQQRELTAAAEALLRELTQTAERLDRRIEAQAGRLRELLDQAARAVERLEALLGCRGADAVLPGEGVRGPGFDHQAASVPRDASGVSSGAEAVPGGAPCGESPIDPGAAHAVLLSEATPGSDRPADRQGVAGGPAGGARSGRSPRPRNALEAQVWGLADAGTDPVEIAERIERPLGEVEVLLNMRKLA